MRIAADMCVYTNGNFVTEVIDHTAAAPTTPSGTTGPASPSSGSGGVSASAGQPVQTQSQAATARANAGFKFHDMI
jgi:hypothetical protein